MMQTFCSAPAEADRFASRLLADTDCQAFGLIERGYAALAQPGSSVSLALTGLLIIAVAFFGYRLLLGKGLALNDAVGLTVKIGIVLIIAGSWESWQALAYNGLARAPAEVASEMLVGIGAPPPLDSLQHALDDLTSASVGYRTRAGIASPLVGGPAAAAAVLNLSSVLLTLSIVGLLVATKVVLAVLLAIAPAMAGLLLFDSTRGMAQNWIGAMAAAAFAPLFVLIVAALEFAILGPMIVRLLAEQSAGTFENTAVMPIGLVVLVFAVALILAVRAGGRISRGVRLSRSRLATAPGPGKTIAGLDAAVGEGFRYAAPSASRPEVSRALESIGRRDSSIGAPRLRSVGGVGASRAARDQAGSPTAESRSLDQMHPRSRARPLRTAPRRSRAAARRDS